MHAIAIFCKQRPNRRHGLEISRATTRRLIARFVTKTLTKTGIDNICFIMETTKQLLGRTRATD